MIITQGMGRRKQKQAYLLVEEALTFEVEDDEIIGEVIEDDLLDYAISDSEISGEFEEEQIQYTIIDEGEA